MQIHKQFNILDMNAQDKMMGSGGCQLVVGSTATAVLGSAYGCTVRVDGTQIKSITQGTAVTNKSWESVALNNGEFIAFGTSITSITLNAATDSVMLWIEP